MTAVGMAIETRNGIMGGVLVPWRFHGDIIAVGTAGYAIGIITGATYRMVRAAAGIESIKYIGYVTTTGGKGL